MKHIFSKLTSDQIDRLFPFYLEIDSSLRLVAHGRSVGKLIDLQERKHFSDHFLFICPRVDYVSFKVLLENTNQLIVLQLVGREKVRIRGQFEAVADSASVLFFGSPWFNDIDHLKEAGLSLFDFAFHDPLADLLQVLKNQEIITSDIKQLLERINRQKKELETSSAKLKASQEQLQLLSRIAEQTINGVIIANKWGETEWVNDSFERLTGYSTEEMVGRTPGSLLQGPESDPATVQYLRERIQAGKAFSCEILNYHKNGDPYWVKIEGHPILDEKGELIKFFALEEDITTRVRTEQALRDAKEKSDASANAMNAFLTNMSHEMRTPLNVILGMGEQFTKTELNDRQRFFMETINVAAENLLVVINEILDLSKIEAGKLDIDAVDFDLKQVFERSVQGLASRAAEKGVDFRLDIDARIAPVLIGDPHRLSQVLLNLAGNAVKFTEEGEITVQAKLIREAGECQTVQFIVADTGIGIEEAFQEVIFNKFTQEDGSIVRKYGGTGLGLNICKQLVELLGGEIELSSRKNQGSTFSFSIEFPIGQVANLPDRQNLAAQSLDLITRKVLLVEDNRMNRMLARTVLANIKAQVTEAENGQQAVELVKVEKFDLILMDIQMPVMDGFEATRRIRELLGNDIPIIALTASAFKGEKERCLEAGMDAYISKPFKENTLINTILKLLQREETDLSDSGDSPVPVAWPAPLYNLDLLRESSDGDEAFIGEVMEAFLFDAGKIRQKVPLCLQQKDAEGLYGAVHYLKANVVMLGMKELEALIDSIERRARAAAFESELERDVDQFIIRLDQVMAQIRQDFSL